MLRHKASCDWTVPPSGHTAIPGKLPSLSSAAAVCPGEGEMKPHSDTPDR